MSRKSEPLAVRIFLFQQPDSILLLRLYLEKFGNMQIKMWEKFAGYKRNT